MAQKKQEQYEDALGSIFDFIFEQSQKSPKKVKPVKITGVDGTTELVDAIGDVLAAPALFVNDSTMDAFNEALDIDLLKVNFGDRGGGVSLNLKDLGAIIKDPGKYVDAQFKKMEAIRKTQRAAATGEIMKSVMAGAWASKKGIDLDTRNAMMGMGRPDAFRHGLMQRSNKLMEKHFVQGAKQFNRGHLIARYGVDKGARLYAMYEKAKTAYQSGTSEEKAKIYSGKADNKSFNVSELYSALESAEIREKAQLETDPEKKLGYVSAARFVDNMAVLQDIKKYQRDSKKAIDFHRKSIETLKSQGAPGSDIDEHRKRIRELGSDLSAVRRYEFASRLGEFQGNYATAKDLFVDGNLLGNIINGKFFDDRYNKIAWLQPAKISTREFKIKGGLGGKKVRGGAISFHMAKDSQGNKLLDAYNEAMMPLYYLSPANLVKSLVTGEVFAYRAYRIQKAFEKKMGAVLAKSIQNFNMESFMEQILEGNGEQLLNSLQSSLSPEMLKRLERFIGRQEGLNRLAYTFGGIERIKKSIQEFINDKISKGIREAIGAKLLTVAFIKKFGEEAVSAWVLKGGIYGLVKGVVSAGLQAIGQAIGVSIPVIGNAIAAVLTTIIIHFGGKMLKPILKFSIQIAIISTLGIVAVFMLFFGFFHLLVFGKHSHVAPHQVVQCSAYTPMGLLPVDEPGYPGYPGDPNDPDWPGPGGEVPPFIPGNLPPGQQCLFSSGPGLRCTQGPYSYCSSDPGYVNNYPPSHLNSPAIDVAVGGNFNAPTFCGSGNCKVVATGQATCRGGYPAGGYVIFTATHGGRTYQFYILHVSIGVTPGQTLSSGQAVATIVDSAAWRMCSSGLHAHLTVQVNGSYVDAREAMNQDFKCNIGECSREQCWPR